MKKHKYIKISLIICFGLLVLFLLVKVVLFATDFKRRYDNKDYKPRRQNNTVWKCSNPEIEFSVSNGDCFGKMKSDKKTVNVRVVFDPGTSTGITVDNYDAVELNQHKYNPSTLIFDGFCKFYKSKCVVTIYHSNVDNIKVGDKITFVKPKS